VTSKQIYVCCKLFIAVCVNDVGRDSSVGITTRYGLDVPGTKSRWGRVFPHPPRPALKPTQPPTQWTKGLFWGQSGRGVALTTHPI